MPQLLLELLSEEIPARMQKRAADDLSRLVAEGLESENLEFDAVHSYATPRRLTVVVDGLPTKTLDNKKDEKGPAVGAPEQAINGFLKSYGLSSVDDCEVREVKGKPTYFFVVEKRGGDTADTISSIIISVIKDFSWPKSMKWGSEELRWVRPFLSILAVFNGEPLFGEVDTGKRYLGAPIFKYLGDVTYGHRFLAPEGIWGIKDFDDYRAKLNKAKVMLDAADRREKIQRDADALAEAEGLTVRPDIGLLDEVAGLVEWPVVLMGSIDEDFMGVPSEVLIAAMRGHQKYFSVLDADGNLAPRFIMVSNMETADEGAAIVAGNERVLRARLADARFFWDQDRRHTLESRLGDLEDIVFHAKLGSVADKAGRMETLAGALALCIDGCDKDMAKRAAKLCKADLLSGMVGEFPALQGKMGGYYALNDGEDEQVADAIKEHYSPAGPGDACPSAPVSVAVALADKIDTLAGFWAIDEKPTGSKDPFALRRAALGVIRLILENGLRISIREVFSTARENYPTEILEDEKKEKLSDSDSLDQTISKSYDIIYLEELRHFFEDRLKVMLKDKGVRHDLIAAVFSLKDEDDLVRILARVEALGDFIDSDDGGNLLVAYKRAANILKIEEKKDGCSYDGEATEGELRQEKALHKALTKADAVCKDALDDEDFSAAMTALAALRGPVDAFFDEVTVNADDVDLRDNRLKLLSGIRTVMGSVADFSKIEG